MIAGVLAPTTRLCDEPGGKITIGGISDRKGFRDCIGFDRADIPRSTPDSVDNWIAARCLRPENARLHLIADQSEFPEFSETFMDFRDQGATCHGYDNGIGDTPAKLF